VHRVDGEKGVAHSAEAAAGADAPSDAMSCPHCTPKWRLRNKNPLLPSRSNMCSIPSAQGTWQAAARVRVAAGGVVVAMARFMLFG
jgi:hypothetical protein